MLVPQCWTEEEVKAAFAEHSLLAAILWDKEELVAQHIANGADLAARDPLGRTALMAAIEHGFPGIVTALLAAGAKPELADTRGRTALALACVKLGNMEIPGSGTAMMETGESACPGALVLHGAVQFRGECLGVYMLVEGRTAHGRPVWKHVSQDRCIAKTSLGNWMVQREHEVGVKDAGLMELRDTTTALPHQSKAVWEVGDGKGWIRAPLLKCDVQEDFAKQKAQREEVLALLAAPTQAAGALDVADDEGNTALQHACLHGLCGVAEQLLAAGARPDLVNKDNKTALVLACAHGLEAAAALLAEPSQAAGVLDAVGDDGFSALLWAEERGLRSVAQKLRECGAADVRRPPLALFRGECSAVQIKVAERTVAFAHSFVTVRSTQRYPLGARDPGAR